MSETNYDQIFSQEEQEYIHKTVLVTLAQLAAMVEANPRLMNPGNEIDISRVYFVVENILSRNSDWRCENIVHDNVIAIEGESWADKPQLIDAQLDALELSIRVLDVIKRRVQDLYECTGNFREDVSDLFMAYKILWRFYKHHRTIRDLQIGFRLYMEFQKHDQNKLRTYRWFFTKIKRYEKRLSFEHEVSSLRNSRKGFLLFLAVLERRDSIHEK
jgi:hypothetical protein